MSNFRNKYKNEIKAYSLLAYPLLHWGVFFVFCLIFVVYMSFNTWDIVTKPAFVGFQNYIDLFTKDDVAMIALKNTIIWTIGVTIFPVAIGLLAAFAISNIERFDVFFRTVLYWPALVSIVATVNLQRQIFFPQDSALANKVMHLFHLPSQAWYESPTIALYTLMLWAILFSFQQPMLFFIAGIKQIPISLYEAAFIDGAKKSTVFHRITFPLLKPIIILNTTLGLIAGFKVIAPMQLLTNGGPANATQSLVYRIYTEGFTYMKMGYASAISVVFLALVLILSAIQYKVQGEQISYE